MIQNILPDFDAKLVVRDFHPLFNLLSSGVSLRRSSIVLKIHPVTVSRKLVYLAKKAQISQKELLLKLQKSKVTHMQFDDLITSEHTKMKPLSVSMAVDVKRRFILGVEVSQIGAFGLLAEKSRKKYGPRKILTNKNYTNFLVKLKIVSVPMLLSNQMSIVFIQRP